MVCRHFSLLEVEHIYTMSFTFTCCLSKILSGNQFEQVTNVENDTKKRATQHSLNNCSLGNGCNKKSLLTTFIIRELKLNNDTCLKL